MTALIKRQSDPDVIVPANDNDLPFQLMDYAEYKASRSYNASQMVIFGLMRVGTLASINARPSKGKTGLAVLLAQLLSSAADFLGRPTLACNVVYIPVEDGNDVANRLHAVDSKIIKIAEFEGGFSLGGNWKVSVEKARKLIQHMKKDKPDRIPVIIIDTLRAALEGQSVLDDRHTSPPLNALRSLAESEGAVIIILNHTNRLNPKESKGETLESLVAMEFLLVEDEKNSDGTLQLWVGKNRNGKAHYLLANVRFTSKTNDDESVAAIIESIAEAGADDGAKAATNLLKKDKKILFEIICTAIVERGQEIRPFGYDGPAVKAVGIESLRPDFYARKVGAHDTQLKAFTRNLDYLSQDEFIVKGSHGGRDVVWLAPKGERAN